MRTLICIFMLLATLPWSAAAVSTGGDQTVTLSAGAALNGSAPAGHGVQWKVKSAPANCACNFSTSGANDIPVTSVQNPTRAEFSHTGAYVLTFTDTTDNSAADVTITVTANSAGDGTVSTARTVRIMPLGDSITAASGGWRFTLQDKLSAGGYQFDFIGGRHLDKDGTHDADHEGHSGWETVSYPQSSEFGWGIDNGGSGTAGYNIDVVGLQPDLVLLMLGTNDVGRGSENASARCARLFQIVDDIWAKVPNARVMVAKIPPFNEGNRPTPISGYASNAAWIAEYNSLIGSTVATRQGQGQGKRISAVDMNAAMTVADLGDGVHPNAGGYAKIAQVWYDGIVAVTNGGGGGGGNQPPTVSLATPSGPFTAPATVNLTASASDSDGTVAKVEFFNGTTKLGEDTSSPYAFSWSSIPAGTYSLSAMTTSSAVSVTVNAAGGGGLPAGDGEHSGQVNGEGYWLPDVQNIRGMYLGGMDDPTKAFCRKWGFGIFYVGMFSLKNAPYNFPQIGAATGHPELTSGTPFIATGLSTGAGFVAKMAETYPNQMIAFIAWNTAFCFAKDNDGWNWNRPTDMDAEKVSIVDLNVAKGVPGMFVQSELDGLVGVTLGQGLFEAGRRVDAPWSYGIAPDSGHTGGSTLPAQYVPDWCDAVVANRYPIGSPLGAVDRSGDWYGNVVTRATAASAGYSGNKQKASWLPNAAWAGTWAGLTKGLPYTLPAVRAKTLPRGIIDESSIQISETLSNLPANARLWPSSSAGVGPWDYENANPTAGQHAQGKGGRWKLCADLDVGDQITPTILPNATCVTGLPASVRGCDYLRPAGQSYDASITIASFRLAQAADVTIALDNRAPAPAWMNGYSPVAGETITIHDGTSPFESPRVLNLYRRSLPAGTTVMLNGTGTQNVLMYLVIVRTSGAQANTAPTVSSGSNQTTTLANGTATVSLSAAVSDDGQVQATPTVTWSSNPSAGASFANANAASSTATFTAAGTYLLTLSAYDGQLSGSGSLTVTVSAAGANQPPSVSLSSPANGAYATAPAGIQLNATASDSDGSIAKVEFFNGATKLGEDASAPYQFTWSNVPVGTYTITAKATDNLGATTTSAAATITVGTDIVLQAEGYAAKNAMTDGGALMGGAGNGSWLRFDGVPLASATYLRFSVSYQGNGDTGVPITVRQGSATGPVLASLTTGAATGSAFVTQATTFTSPGITQALYVVFGGGNGAAYYDWFLIDSTPVDGGGGGSSGSGMDSIAVNLGSPAMGTSESAGVVSATHWTTITDTASVALMDGNGTATTASHAFSSSNWGLGVNTDIADAVGDARMLRGWVDQTSGLTHSVSAIPFASYDLYLYFDRLNDSNIGSFVHKFTITDAAGAVLAGPFYAKDAAGTAFAGWVEVPTTSTSDQQASTPAGNVLRIRNLTTATIRIMVGSGNESWGQNGFSRSALGGFEIVRVAAGASAGTPTFSPTPGTYASAQSVTLACATGGATIHYTTDGSTPTSSSLVYGGAISVASTTTIKAMATAPGMGDSAVASATYTITSPTITSQPANVAVAPGQTATFSVTASGTGPLTYQWKRGATNVGGNSATLTITNAQVANAGSYTCTVTNSAGSATSNAAMLTVTSAGGSLDPLIPWTTVISDGGGGWSGSGNTADKAFDGNTGTFYDAAAGDSAYAGIDVGAGGAATVTAIRYWARGGWSNRMIGGVFEGSNNPTSGYASLGTVATASDTAWTTLTVTGASAYRYLRYRGPSGGLANVAEIEFHGRVVGASPWANRDVGSTAFAGSTSVSSGVYTLRGSGADIWGTVDACEFASQQLTGDGSIVARVVSVQNTDPWAKAGVMIREGTAAGAKHAFCCATAGNGIAFQRRPVTGAATSHTAGSLSVAPRWVKLVRQSTTITGYESADGVSWTVVGSATIGMTNPVQIGLAVTSHNNGVLCTAVFDNVIVTPGGSG